MRYALIIEDDILEVGSLGADAISRLRSWYYTAQTEANIEQEIKRELEEVSRGAIEGVTNMHPEHIIIDLR